MAFSGYLLKAGGFEIPTSFIAIGTYKVTPNQRLETSAERNTDGMLIRSTVAHTPTKIEFQTIRMYNSQVNAFMTYLSNAYTDVLAKKLSLNYYVPDLDAYQTGEFYVPDINFTIFRVVSSSVLQYEQTRIAFIEY
jgi:hypothetical protein